ncbi:hypothetical protein OIU76_020123 [Salix suchowensis]|nr:hypothetical protein OIU76_020123 [Salix suchowensis]
MKLGRKFKESGFGFSPVTNQFKVTRMISQCAHDAHTGEERPDVSMGVLGGCLCICDASSYHPINVKVLKDSGVKESWTRVFSTATLNGERWPYGLYQPMKYMDDGTLLVFPYSRHARIHYDPRDLGLKHFKFHGVKSNSKCAELKLQHVQSSFFGGTETWRLSPTVQVKGVENGKSTGGSSGGDAV